MSDDRPRRAKSLKDRVRELVQDVLETLEELLLPPRELVPIPRPRR